MPALVPPVPDERAGLLAFLAQQRAALRIAAHGLTDEQARATPTASTLSVGGLVKHAAHAETVWIDRIRRQPSAVSADDFARSFVLGPQETLAGALERYAEVAARMDAVLAVIPDLAEPVPVPQHSFWHSTDPTGWSVRWVLLHLIQETARHAGHADIIRESIDGATAFPLMAAVEGWPESDRVKPWRPAS